MSKEEYLKIQTCVLKVNIHCEGCKRKVKKILHKIDGVYIINIEAESGKVTISGNVDPATLIKKLNKHGKYAELLDAAKGNNGNQNQLKNMQIENGKGVHNNKGHRQNGNNTNPPPAKGGNLPPAMPTLQQLQQLQQMKALQDLTKLPPQFNVPVNVDGVKVPNPNPIPKAVKLGLPEENDMKDDDSEDDFDDDFEDDDKMEEMPPVNKMKPPAPKPMVSNGGGAQIPNMMMNIGVAGQHPQFMNGGNGGGNGSYTGDGIANKGGGGGGNIPVQANVGAGSSSGGKKRGNGKNAGDGASAQKGGMNGGAPPQDGQCGGGVHSKNGNNGHGGAAAGGGGIPIINGNGVLGMPNMMATKAAAAAAGNMGPNGGMPMGPRGAQMGQMSNLPIGHVPAVQGLPAAAMNGGFGANANGGYFQGAGPAPTGNPYHQQQVAAMMMNQQRAANANERFQSLMYARPPPAINYMPPDPCYPYQLHPPPPPPSDNYFNDENTAGCSVM